MADNNEETVLKTFLDIMKNSMPDSLISNYVVIAEVVGNEANQLSILTSPGMTPWLATGMLQSSIDMIMSGQETYFEDDDE